MGTSASEGNMANIKLAVDFKVVAEIVDKLALIEIVHYETSQGITFDEDTRAEAESAAKAAMWKIIDSLRERRMEIWQRLFDVADKAYREHITQRAG